MKNISQTVSQLSSSGGPHALCTKTNKKNPPKTPNKMQYKNELCYESKQNQSQSIKQRRKRKIVYVPYFTLIIDEDCKQIGFVNFFFF